MLLQHSLVHSEDSDIFVDAAHLFYDWKSVLKFNNERLQKVLLLLLHSRQFTPVPLLQIQKSGDAGGLHPFIFIVRGAKLMLTPTCEMVLQDQYNSYTCYVW